MSGKQQNIAIKLHWDASRFRHKSRIPSRDPGILLVKRVCGFPMDLSYAGDYILHIFGNVGLMAIDKLAGFQFEHFFIDVFFILSICDEILKTDIQHRCYVTPGTNKC